MRRYFAFILLLAAALLSGCQRQESLLTEPTVTTAATESTDPVQTEEPTTAPTEPDTSWLVDDWESLSYEEFFSEVRTIHDNCDGYTDWWIGEEEENQKRYSIGIDQEGLYIQFDDYRVNPGPVLYRIPESSEFYNKTVLIRCGIRECQLVLTNGKWCYLALENGEILQVDMLSGAREVLYEGNRIRDMSLLGRDVLYFADEQEDRIGIYRLYLPSKTLDLLYDQISAPVPYDQFYFFTPEDDSTGILTFQMINPEFAPLLQAELRDLDSPYRQTEWGKGMEDSLWLLEDIENPDWSDKSILWLCWAVQDESGVRPFLRGEVDCFTGECTVRLGCIDNCWFGTGEDHDHYGPMENPPFRLPKAG